MKVCQTCKTEKPENEYHRNRHNPDGLHKSCKECRCTAARQPESRQKSKEARWRREGEPEPPRSGWVENGIGYIPLTQGQVAKVDPQDVAWLTQWNWGAGWVPSVHNFYASRGGWENGKKRYILMHRVILDILDSPLKGDHKNHDTLDNRRENLRIATVHQNNQNSRRIRPTISGLRGARFDKSVGRYRCEIGFNGEKIYLGYFDTAEEAHARYLEAAKELHGEFAYSQEVANVV